MTKDAELDRWLADNLSCHDEVAIGNSRMSWQEYSTEFELSPTSNITYTQMYWTKMRELGYTVMMCLFERGGSWCEISKGPVIPERFTHESLEMAVCLAIRASLLKQSAPKLVEWPPTVHVDDIDDLAFNHHPKSPGFVEDLK